MTLENKVQLVEKLFDQLEKETLQFQEASGIGCVSGCGKCCTYPNIEASPLEFLPWAFHLFLSGKAEDALTSINKYPTMSCFILAPVSIIGKGHCGSYRHRGLICRLFGYAANRDKYGNLRLVTCKTIKEEQTDNYLVVSEAILKEMQEVLEGNFFSANWGEIKDELAELELEIEVGEPRMIESYNLNKESFSLIMLTKYDLDEENSYTLAMVINGILLKDRLVWMAYYLEYEDQSTFETIKAKSNLITNSLLKANR